MSLIMEFKILLDAGKSEGTVNRTKQNKTKKPKNPSLQSSEINGRL